MKKMNKTAASSKSAPMKEWEKWFQKQVELSGMKVKRIPLVELSPDWEISKKGDLERPDGRFFEYTGVHVKVSQSQREVSEWKQPMTIMFGVGCVFLVVSGNKFLLQAKLEPGNDPSNNFVMLNAPISAGQSNLTGAHGGKRPPRAELAETHKVNKIAIPQDGGKYIQKLNEYGYIEIGESEIDVLNQNERWFTMDEIEDAIKKQLVGDHLLQALAVYFVLNSPRQLLELA